MNTPASIQTPRSSAVRPLIITVLCILGFIATAANVPTLFADAARNVGPWYPAFLALNLIVTAICMIGLWNMRRWAVFVYAGMAVLGTVILFTMGVWNLTAMLVRVAVVTVMFSQLSKMK